MPVKQRSGKTRRPQLSAEALALFLELERTPRHHQGFTAKSKRLANLLNLSDEWWGGCDVNDASHAPCWPPWCASHGYWFAVREVREELLEAAA